MSSIAENLISHSNYVIQSILHESDKNLILKPFKVVTSLGASSQQNAAGNAGSKVKDGVEKAGSSCFDILKILEKENIYHQKEGILRELKETIEWIKKTEPCLGHLLLLTKLTTFVK